MTGTVDVPTGWWSAPPRTVPRRPVEDVEAELVRLRTHADVPPEPDRAWVDGWLHRSHVSCWAELDRTR